MSPARPADEGEVLEEARPSATACRGRRSCSPWPQLAVPSFWQVHVRARGGWLRAGELSRRVDDEVHRRRPASFRRGLAEGHSRGRSDGVDDRRRRTPCRDIRRLERGGRAGLQFGAEGVDRRLVASDVVHCALHLVDGRTRRQADGADQEGHDDRCLLCGGMRGAPVAGLRAWPLRSLLSRLPGRRSGYDVGRTTGATSVNPANVCARALARDRRGLPTSTTCRTRENFSPGVPHPTTVRASEVEERAINRSLERGVSWLAIGG